MFRNIPPVTKNILILNILFWVGSLVMASKNIDLIGMLGAYYFNSPNFEPYQVVTHFFMHSIGRGGNIDIFHILINMFLLVMFGGHLERIWGPKRFFIFYLSAAMGALFLYNIIGVFQIIELQSTLEGWGYDLVSVNNALMNDMDPLIHDISHIPIIKEYYIMINTPMVGASGAVFGLLAGFAMLFPNTELMLLFPPIPIKAKYLIGGYLLFEVYSSFSQQNDQIAHLAHVGGAIVGIIYIIIWRRRDRSNFW